MGRVDLLPGTRLEVSAHVYDLHTAYLATSNILLPHDPDERRKKERKRLSYACRAYGIEGWEMIDKPEMAKAIGEGRWREYGREAVLDYCEEDMRNSAELLRRQLAGHDYRAPVDPELVMRWSDYCAKTVARIQARGMPIDMWLWNLVQENKGAVVARADPAVRSEPGQRDTRSILRMHEWSNERFEHWLASRWRSREWPRLTPARSNWMAMPFA